MSKPKPRPSLADKENPSWTKADFSAAKRVEDIPALAALTKRRPGQRGPQKAPRKVPVSLRVDQKVIEAFKATGEGWQSKMNEVLAKAAKNL